MALHPDVQDRAFRFFIEEAPDLLQTIESELLLIRSDLTRSRVHNLMRAAHSIKGGAANVGLEAIKTLAHRLEDIFRSFYNEALQINDDLEALLLQAYDCLKNLLLGTIEQGTAFDSASILEVAEAIFSQLENHLGDYLVTEDQLPTVAEMGIDIAQSIFEVDVAQALQRLDTVALNPSQPTLMVELRSQAEVFAGLAELLNLPGLGEISALTLQALDRYPQQATQILDVALADFKAAQQVVLAGDRQHGGSPSMALQHLAQGITASLEISADGSEAHLDDVSGTYALTGDAAELATADQAEIWGQPFTQASESDRISTLEASSDLTALPNSTLEDVFSLAMGSDTQTALETALDPSLECAVDHEQVLASDPVESQLVDADPAPSPTLESVFGQAEISANREPQSLEVALTQIEQAFDQLSLAQDPQQPKRDLAKPTVAKPEPMKNPAVAASGISVRLDLDQLERMNNQLGELAINRNKLSLQNEQLQGSLRDLLARFDQFRTIGKDLRSLLTKLLINPDRATWQWLQGSRPPNLDHLGVTRPDFDVLELDTYSEVYNLLQAAVDQISQLEEKVEDVTLYSDRSGRELELQRQMLTNLRNELMWARMLPLGDILNRFPRLLRDLSLQYKKGVDLKLSGTSVLVDKAVLEKLYDPLVHLVRNAFDHGIEENAIRLQQGKPEQGVIQIRAYHQGSRTVIEVQDDGRGIDLEQVRAKAIQQNLIRAEDAETASTARLLNLLFEPGLSTASQVSELSGRGVGLDIVKAQIQALKGTITITSKPGEGTTFTLQIPLTLSISKLLVIWSGNSLVAIPSDSIEEILIPKADQIKVSSGQRFLHWRHHVVPVHKLQSLLPYHCALPEMLPDQWVGSVPVPDEWAAPLLLLSQGGDVVALEVNRFLTEQELVIKPFSTALAAPSYLYGCTIMGDGNLIPVLDGVSLLSKHQGRSLAVEVDQSAATEVTPSLRTILIVDDSAGMRQTLSLTLEKAGYRVLQAHQGREALDQLQQNAHIHLVICDIEMPVMNGFEFLTQRRQDPQLSQIPVVMLTSRSGDKHKRLALQLGAADYFTKPYVEQNLLASLQVLLQSAVVV